jgi:hypothetical protein
MRVSHRSIGSTTWESAEITRKFFSIDRPSL